MAAALFPVSRRVLAILGLATILVLACFALDKASLTGWLHVLQQIEAGSNPFRAGDFRAAASFVLIASLMIMIGTPRLIFFTLGGISFGFTQGLFWSLGACLTGSFLTFLVARRVSRAWLVERLSEDRMLSHIVNARPSILTVALLRALPISNLVISTGLALGRANRRTFIVGSLIGYLPQGVIAVLIGSGLANKLPMNMIGQNAGHITHIAIAGMLMLGLYFWASRAIHQRVQREASQSGHE